jgi:hypothetical protein
MTRPIFLVLTAHHDLQRIISAVAVAAPFASSRWWL